VANEKRLAEERLQARLAALDEAGTFFLCVVWFHWLSGYGKVKMLTGLYKPKDDKPQITVTGKVWKRPE
jgi:hypothetical protein